MTTRHNYLKITPEELATARHRIVRAHNRIASAIKNLLLPAFIRRPEMLLFSLFILVFNAPLLVGSCWHAMMFHPEAVRQGQWWRLFTHPWVHLTWYHLLLDGSAFFILYHSLLEQSLVRRAAYVVAAAAGSLLFSWLGPNSAYGLCGLSGTAHGLMAISALELVSAQPLNSPERRVGMAAFGFVVAKAAYEGITGHMFFAFLDFGLLGNPISVAHAGGIIGALVIMLLCGLFPVRPIIPEPSVAGPESSTIDHPHRDA